MKKIITKMVKNANTEISCYDLPNFKSDEAAQDLTQYGKKIYTFPLIYRDKFPGYYVLKFEIFFAAP